MKRIVLLRTNSYNYDSRVQRTVKALSKINHVTVLAWDRNENYAVSLSRIESGSGRVTIVSYGIKAKFGNGLLKISQYAKYFVMTFRWLVYHRRDYDAIHACDFYTAIIAFFFKVFYRKVLVYDIFDYYIDSHNIPRLIKRVLQTIDRIIMKASDYVILCNEEREKQVPGVKKSKLVIVHNSPDVELSSDLSANCGRIASRKKKICYIGILGKGRLLPELLEFVSNNDGFELWIGGFGEYEELVMRYSLENNNIRFFGKVEYESVLRIESMCDIMVATYDPSIRNNRYSAPNKFYEAMLLGIPILVCKGMGLDKIVEEYEIGIAVDYSFEGLKAGLESLVEGYKTYKNAMVTKGRRLYDTCYSWQVMEERLNSIYA